MPAQLWILPCGAAIDPDTVTAIIWRPSEPSYPISRHWHISAVPAKAVVITTDGTEYAMEMNNDAAAVAAVRGLTSDINALRTPGPAPAPSLKQEA